jgi:hypothetical protein
VDCTFIYTASGIIYSRTIELLSFRGMDEPDQLEKVGVVHECLDGSIVEQILGFRKIITATVRPITSALDRRFLVKFFLSNDRTIKYGNYISGVVCDEEMLAEWIEDCEHGREFTFRLTDTHVYHSWSDGVTGDDLLYMSAEIEITGTEETPQTLTTGQAPIEHMANGSDWPAFNDDTYDFVPIPVARDGTFYGVVKASIAETAGSLSFQIFHSDTGNPASDGKFYCVIALFLQAK